MATRVERRLAAILAADVVGYSRLVEQNEADTLVALRALRREVIDPRIAAHHGRIVKLMGDGIIAEFGSVVAGRQDGRRLPPRPRSGCAGIQRTTRSKF
jgi:adenylate cyclase